MLGTGGTLNAPLTCGACTLPARTYNGLVTGGGSFSLQTAGAGTHIYNGGFTLQSFGIYDLSVNNPNVIVTTFTVGTSGLLKMGSGLWQVGNNWSAIGSTITQTAGGTLRFNGTGQQDVYSSSNTYFQIDDANTSTPGVRFHDSFTVSTFTSFVRRHDDGIRAAAVEYDSDGIFRDRAGGGGESRVAVDD